MSGRSHRLALTAIVPALLAAACCTPAQPNTFEADVRALTRAEHRLAGTPPARRAIQYLAKRLRDAGVQTVIEQPFIVPQMSATATLRVGERTFPLHAMRANLWQAPITGSAPIVAPTLYVGEGRPADYGTNRVDGKIAVMDYATARRWRDAFALGADALIFVGSDTMPAQFTRFENICADMPRFYIKESDAGAAGILDAEPTVSIEARAGWKGCAAHNLLAWIPGTDPVFSQDQEEVIVLATQVDSFSQVPYLSRGTRRAANCAALLDYALRLHHAPPRRSILIAFLNAEARCLSGSQALYSAIFRNAPFLTYKRTHADFLTEYGAEKDFLQRVLGALNAEDIFDVQDNFGRRALELLRLEAEYQTHEVQAMLRDQRLRQHELEECPERKATEASIVRHLAEEKNWNQLRRALAKDDLVPENMEHLEKVKEAIRANLGARDGELDLLTRNRKLALQIGGLLADKTIVLHLCLDLGDRAPRWGLAHNEYALRGGDYNNVGYYVGVFGAFSQLVRELRATDENALSLLEPETTKTPPATKPPAPKKSIRRTVKKWLNLLEPETTRVQLGPPIFFPITLLHSGQIASRFGVYGLQLASCHDYLPFDGHPQDTPDNIDVDRIRVFAHDAFPLIQAAASSPELSLRQRIRPTAFYEEPKWSGDKASGYNVMTRSAGSAIANQPADGAMLASRELEESPGFDLAVRYVADQNGNFSVGPLPRYPMTWCCATFDEAGAIATISPPIGSLRRVELFPCHQHSVVSLLPPDFPDARTLILNAASDGLFRREEFLAMEQNQTVTFFVPNTARRVKLVNPFGIALLKATDTRPDGEGFAVGPAWTRPKTPVHSANDLHSLNENRMDLLRERRITNDSLEWLHGLAKSALERGRQARTLAEHTAELCVSHQLSRRVYAPLLKSINDLVKAVVILLVLTIPFAYALERLIVGTPHIYRQIGWYVLFFLLTFGILYKVHPAFAIATEPIVIFLAFFIIILSSIVILILLSRFQSEIKRVQGLESTVHTADVSRFSTVMAAVAMGISTMRRRPMRTIFTTVTVILLTFSILSFASFDAQQGILRRYIGAAKELRCIFVHHALWKEIPDQMVTIIRHVAGNDSTVTERHWVAPTSAEEADTFSLLVATENGRRHVQVKAIVGLHQTDLEQQPELGACFPSVTQSNPFDHDSILLPPAVADAMNLHTGDALLVRGRSFNFAGRIDVEALTRYVQIDESPIFPVDYSDESLAHEEKETGSASEAAETLSQANLQTDSAFLPYLSANQVAVIHSARAQDLDSTITALTVYPGAGRSIGALADRFARICGAPLYVTMPDGVYRLFFTTLFATAGTGNLIIPIVLGGLIVFGTMLGSVADREKEIYSFSALGLAPTHIGMLFFAEASVYAVVGGLGGYILAQVVAHSLGWLATFTSITVPEMNYSSTNAIFAILTVMLTVLLSTIYPAYRGSKSANPGLARSWSLPAPKQDLWEFTFPFTVSEYDITGVMSFLQEHFDNFSDCSLGLFLAEDTRVYSTDDGLNLTSRLALAPFDLGVTQHFLLTSMPSEIEGVDEVRIVMKRISGTRGDWQRTNRPFISDLRKQFLIWRSIPHETMELYRRRTLALLGKNPEPNQNAPPAHRLAEENGSSQAEHNQADTT